MNPPDISGNEHSYLVTFLYDLGAQWKAGFDVVALPFTEILAWSNLMQMQIEPFEAEVIRALSSAHVAIATNPEADCPLTFVDDEIREVVSSVNESGWKSLARSNG